MKINFVKMGINGEGIGYLNKKPVFCTGVFPNETADVTIIEEKKNYAIATLDRIIEPSKHRVDSICAYQSKCGGCPLLTMDYNQQLVHKKELLVQALYKYGGVRRNLIRDIHRSEHEIKYRSALKLPVHDFHHSTVTGMYEPNTNHFIQISGCKMHKEGLERMRREVMLAVNQEGLAAYDKKREKGLRYLVIRGIEGKYQICFVTGKQTIKQELIDKIMEIKGVASLNQSINTNRHGTAIFGKTIKHLSGDESIQMEFHGITIKLSMESFFQLNLKQAEAMYDMAVSKIDPCETLVEAYCGIGVMSLLAKDKANHIIGIESVESAVRNARHNAKLNGLQNKTDFLCKDAAQGLLYVLMRQEVDTLLVDPPRSGMDDLMLETILKSSIRKIIYVSCNPSTLGKNIAVLKENYDVKTVIPYDMFPNTPHVESITVLERKKGK